MNRGDRPHENNRAAFFLSTERESSACTPIRRQGAPAGKNPRSSTGRTAIRPGNPSYPRRTRLYRCWQPSPGSNSPGIISARTPAPRHVTIVFLRGLSLAQGPPHRIAADYRARVAELDRRTSHRGFVRGDGRLHVLLQALRPRRAARRIAQSAARRIPPLHGGAAPVRGAGLGRRAAAARRRGGDRPQHQGRVRSCRTPSWFPTGRS